MKLKVSVIGVGHLGSIHAKLWKQHERAELVGVYDVNTESAAIKAQELNVPLFDSIDYAIAESDAITIAVPTSEHFDVAMQCLQQNKHVLIEKPITHTYQQALTSIEEAKKRNLIIQVGHVERFNPALVAANEYNLRPLFIETHRLSQFRPRATDVSVIHDLMIHDIDIVLWLAQSSAKSISANGVAVLTETPDLANARVEFENGCVANFTASRISAAPMRKMRIFQKNAYLSLDFAKPSIEVYRLADNDEKSSGVPAMMLGQIEQGTKQKNIVYEQPTVVQSNAIAEEQKSFIASVLDNAPVSVTATDAAEALRIAEEITRIIESQTTDL
ncbi:MAG: Gfo/Idh/MocA family oxidoreductase [Candidatus Kapaibacterium sp.]